MDDQLSRFDETGLLRVSDAFVPGSAELMLAQIWKELGRCHRDGFYRGGTVIALGNRSNQSRTARS